MVERQTHKKLPWWIAILAALPISGACGLGANHIAFEAIEFVTFNPVLQGSSHSYKTNKATAEVIGGNVAALVFFATIVVLRLGSAKPYRRVSIAATVLLLVSIPLGLATTMSIQSWHFGSSMSTQDIDQDFLWDLISHLSGVAVGIASWLAKMWAFHRFVYRTTPGVSPSRRV